MPRFAFSDIYGDVQTISNVKGQTDLLKRSVQMALDRVTSYWDWPWLMLEDFITTVNPYTAGTVTATADSKTVTGSSTTFTSAMVGRKLRVSSEKAYYTIAAFVSATEITLDQPYQGSAAAGSTYSIYQDEYRLAADIDHYKLLRQIQNGVALLDLDIDLFDIILPTPTAQADPIISSMLGSKLDTYATGTVSISQGGSVVTGSGTSWTSVEKLGRGNRLLIGSQVFTVKSLDSATQITTYETANTAAAGGTSYTLFMDNIRVKLYQIPSAARNIYYRYQRIPFPLIADTDIPDMPDEWHWLLVQGGLLWAYAQQGDLVKVQNQETMFRSYIMDMVLKQGYISGNIVRRRRSEDIVPQRPGKLLYPAQYDVRYTT